MITKYEDVQSKIESLSNDLSNVQSIALSIYGKYNLEKSLLWMLEEFGELVSAIRKNKDSEDIKEELSDLFVWLICICNILNFNSNDVIIMGFKKEIHRQITEYGFLKYWHD